VRCRPDRRVPSRRTWRGALKHSAQDLVNTLLRCSVIGHIPFNSAFFDHLV
jgi:hypothetical protein